MEVIQAWSLSGWSLIFWLIIILIIGAVLGLVISRFTMKKYFEKNPPISEDVVIAMLTSMGQRPNQKQVNKIMKNIKNTKK